MSLKLGGLKKSDKSGFEALYKKYNSRGFVHPDPLEFLYHYESIAEREIVGIIASVLAYGRVEQILKSVSKVLSILGEYPRESLLKMRDPLLKSKLANFKHRFTTGEEIYRLLLQIKKTIKRFGSLNNAFLECGVRGDMKLALDNFAILLNPKSSYLVPKPSDGSACKRMNLYLRWMVREDAVDPGGWEGVSPADLLIPLDTHMAKIGRLLKMTDRKNPNMNMALDITESFRKIEPNDPVKYDFVLTRFGIRKDVSVR